jgi:hypothetical protein
MADSATTQSELLLEAQRTTHAVRAIARFVILQVTYTVVGALLIGLGTMSLAAPGATGLTVILIIGGGGVIIAGLIHSLQSGWDELNKSNRLAPPITPATRPAPEKDPPEKAPFELLEGTCECSKWDRGVGNTGVRNGVKYCGRCKKALDA